CSMARWPCWLRPCWHGPCSRPFAALGYWKNKLWLAAGQCSIFIFPENTAAAKIYLSKTESPPIPGASGAGGPFCIWDTGDRWPLQPYFQGLGIGNKTAFAGKATGSSMMQVGAVQ